MARQAAQVVSRCIETTENGGILDLSECQLCQLPDAVYHLMRNTPLTVCNLSGNLLSKIPPNFALKFPLITELNLSHNKMSKIPDELVDCVELRKLDMSHNSFVSIPSVIFKLPKLKMVKLDNNFIMEAEDIQIPKDTALEEMDLRDNPLNDSSHELLSSLAKFTILMSPREEHEWDDL